MKIKHLLGAMLISVASSAQNTIEYGNAPADVASGLSQVGGDFFLTGDERVGNSNNLVLIRDIPGSPIFSNHYQLRNASNVALRVRGSRVLGLGGGSSFVAGTFVNAPLTSASAGIFTSIIDGAGVPQNTFIWQVPALVTGNPEVTAVTMSPGGTELYVCGNIVDNSAGTSIMFAIALDNNMNLIWSARYDVIGMVNERVADMVFSPFANALQLVCNGSPNALNQGILAVRIDANTGGVAFATRISLPNGSISARAIVAQTDPVEQGFLITGAFLNTNLTNNLLVLRITTNSTSVVSASSIPYSGTAGQTGLRIAEQPGVNGNQYVIVGQAAPGIIGGGDISAVVVSNQAALISDIFTFGKSGTTENPVGLSVNNGDISILATTSAGTINTGASDFYFYQAIGSLRGGCSGSSFTGQQVQFTPQQNNASVAATYGLEIYAGNLVLQNPVNMHIRCSPARIGSFDEAESNDNASSVSLFPNPVSAGAPLQVLLHAGQTGEVRFTLHDITGREVFVQTIIAAEGTAQYQIQLPQQLASGLYSMNIVGEGLKQSQRLVIE
ncbi:MAG: T9SS type A sorting domain-containing protein [Bacteroidia bacterium]|nr:T9SS type A sorting domain-containing protein [Bacteroidia bacterium]